MRDKRREPTPHQKGLRSLWVNKTLAMLVKGRASLLDMYACDLASEYLIEGLVRDDVITWTETGWRVNSTGEIIGGLS